MRETPAGPSHSRVRDDAAARTPRTERGLLRTAFPAKVLIVDDAPESRRALRRAMDLFGHDAVEAESAMEARKALRADVALILLDLEMPGMDGLDFVELIRADPRSATLPVIMVTGHDTREDRLGAVAVGVSDFIGKPFEILELYLRCEAQLRLKASRDEVEAQRDSLELEVRARTQDLRAAFQALESAHNRERQAHMSTLRALVLAAEFKDWDTAAHIDRISRYCEVLADGLGMPLKTVELIRSASPLHDVGKIGIPDSVLLTPGPLQPADWEIMRQHPEIGARILSGSDADLMKTGRVFALTHHERWDGSGYPRGLAGTDIPIEGRICAVADVFDALTTDRRYRRALPNDEVYDLMGRAREAHFDPAVLDVFTQERQRIEEIQSAFRERSSGGFHPSGDSPVGVT